MVTAIHDAELLSAQRNSYGPIDVVIETRILPGDPVSGMKSQQNISIDFNNKRVSQVYKTGTTYGISSVRDEFKVTAVEFKDEFVNFRATGRTASGVMVMPDIDYDFKLSVSANGSASLVGNCHDGYPAYAITVSGRTLYQFNHRPIRLYKLFGDCDVRPPRKNIPPMKR